MEQFFTRLHVQYGIVVHACLGVGVCVHEHCKSTHMYMHAYRLYANKIEDLINERKIDFACASK